MPQPDILARITAGRRERIAVEGAALGVEVPQERRTPLRPFLAAPEIICEIKRRSPSAGSIAEIRDPVAQAGEYQTRGVPSVSVLTEEDHFGGSLKDLMAVKNAYPELSVLRKDFLFDSRDVELSYRAGADALLLIAAILSAEAVGEILAAAEGLGLAVLAEAHDERDLEKLRPHRLALLGVNSRDLTTFRVDPLTPLGVVANVDWPCRMVFESGIYEAEDVQNALGGGFHGILVGESVVRSPERIPRLIEAIEESYHREPEASGVGGSGERFWNYVAGHPARARSAPTSSTGSATTALRRPLVKVCGIAREEDARLAVELGAQMLGFIIADSPRELPEERLRELLRRLAGEAESGSRKGGAIGVPCIGVLVARRGGELDERRLGFARSLLSEGLITAIQLHGDERPEECASIGMPYYKAVRPRSPEELEAAGRFRSPRILLDGYAAARYGGTGTSVAEEIVDRWRQTHILWLAGGFTAENVAERILRFEPELIDVASGVEASPGEKSPEKLNRLFEEIEYATRG